MSPLSESRKRDVEIECRGSDLDAHTPPWRASGYEVGRLAIAVQDSDGESKEGVGGSALTA